MADLCQAVCNLCQCQDSCCCCSSIATESNIHTTYKCSAAHCPGLPGWASTRRNIHPLTYPDHQPSFISFFYLLWSIALSLFNLHAWWYFCTTSLQVLFGLLLGLEPSTSYAIHFFTQAMFSFRNTCHTIAYCFAVVPRLYHLFLISLNSLLGTLSFTINNITHPSDHSHLCSLKCHLVFFPDRPGLTSMWHTTLHTTAIQPPSPNQWYIPSGKQWYQLPEFILSNLDSGLHSCISISIHTQRIT